MRLGPATKARPADIWFPRFHENGDSLAVDVVIRSPFTDTNWEHATSTSGGLTAWAEDEKFRLDNRRRHQAALRQHQQMTEDVEMAVSPDSNEEPPLEAYTRPCTFVPFAFDVGGRPGVQACACMIELARLASKGFDPEHPYLFARTKWIQRVSILVHSMQARWLACRAIIIEQPYI